jgi:ABC-2 type transport system ATP-binding protein
MPPTSGRVRLLGLDPARDSRRLRRALGVVFQNPALDPQLTVRENLECQGKLYDLGGRTLGDRIDARLARFDLADRAGDRVRTLSGGLKRRVELARALLSEPELLLLDEPTTGLDPAARRAFWELIRELRAERAARGGGAPGAGGADAAASAERAAGPSGSARPLTILLSTHLLDEAEQCDRLALLDAGRFVAEGTPHGLTAELGGDVVAVSGPDPTALLADIRRLFEPGAALSGDEVRFERPKGHRVAAEVVEAFPGRITAVRVARPTLEDVFVRKTGRRLA